MGLSPEPKAQRLWNKIQQVGGQTTTNTINDRQSSPYHALLQNTNSSVGNAGEYVFFN